MCAGYAGKIYGTDKVLRREQTAQVYCDEGVVNDIVPEPQLGVGEASVSFSELFFLVIVETSG